MLPYRDAIGPARTATAAFLDARSRTQRLVVFCHFDADGLAAGAVLGRALRGESAFSDSARARLARLQPHALVVTDLGVDSTGVLPGVPTLFIDHHRPEGEPQNAVVVSGYGWEPIPCSAWLAYDLLAPAVDIADLAWIAAIGIISDLGDNASWPELPAVKKRYTAKWLREAVALINASRRASAFDVETPLAMLMTADDPKAISQNDALGAQRLRAYRAEVNAALQQARRQPPTFSNTQSIALIRLHSACQIHPLIAQQWHGRLQQHVVIGANTGYLPGVVAFSARTARTDISIPVLLQSIDLGTFDSTSFGRGHDKASGGHLPPHVFNRLLDALGFEPRTHVLLDSLDPTETC
jgi:single-stranded-DNA-specific exonuclease